MTKKHRLTTLIGGIIDRMSYGQIAFYITSILLFSATYFWILNPYGHGTNIKNLSWFDSLYYCVITFSSLGYGDILPVGFGKLIACLEVLSGLILTAIFVGKIASERQSAMLRLVYTSEHQRRLVEFEKEIYVLNNEFDNALSEHNHEKLYDLSKSTYRFVASINNYLRFQANQGGLASFGNTSSLRRLYKSISQLQITIYDVIRTYGVQDKTRTKLEQIIFRINSIALIMKDFHLSDPKINALLFEIKKLKENLDGWNQKLKNGNPEYKFRTEITDFLTEKVLEKMPQKPWPKHIQKIIATELGIQNKLAQKCIDKLIEDGKL